MSATLPLPRPLEDSEVGCPRGEGRARVGGGQGPGTDGEMEAEDRMLDTGCEDVGSNPALCSARAACGRGRPSVEGAVLGKRCSGWKRRPSWFWNREVETGSRTEQERPL